MRCVRVLIMASVFVLARAFRASNLRSGCFVPTVSRLSARLPARLHALNAKRALSTHQDTIYALSSGAGQAGVSVVRVSGPQAKFCLKSLIGEKQTVPAPRYASVRRLYSPTDGELLDLALVLWFPAPRSFTGDDTVEFHVHGSRSVVQGLFDSFQALQSRLKAAIRPAERGEFTQRAFENGRMDLTEIEGLADLIAADTAQQRKLALRQMQGSLRKLYDDWRGVLVKALAHTEAVIDFGEDEHDVTDHAFDAIVPEIRQLSADISRHLADNRRGEIIRSGIRIAIAGPPNAGKSSLMNALASRDVAIVSPIAGTTRDTIQVQLDLDGYSVVLHDTAGIRADPDNSIEIEGIKRAKQVLEDAHITVFVADVTDPASIREMLAMLQAYMQQQQQQQSWSNGTQLIIVANKIDLVPELANRTELDASALLSRTEKLDALPAAFQQTVLTKAKVVGLSCQTGTGLSTLLSRMRNTTAEQFDQTGGETALITRERHRRHLQDALQCLDNFLHNELPMDLAAEELRLALMHIGECQSCRGGCGQAKE